VRALAQPLGAAAAAFAAGVLGLFFGHGLSLSLPWRCAAEGEKAVKAL
jgi:hypothetical protein